MSPQASDTNTQRANANSSAIYQNNSNRNVVIRSISSTLCWNCDKQTHSVLRCCSSRPRPLPSPSPLATFVVVKMPGCCVVPGCSVRGGFKFPSDAKLNKLWRIAVKREGPNKGLWVPSQTSTVCGKHFKSEDFREPVASYVTVGGKKVRLLAHQAVPSIFPHVPASSQLAKEREERLAKRRKQQEPGM